MKKQNWIEIGFKKSDIDGKPVKYNFKVDGETISGDGWFEVLGEPTDKVCVKIITESSYSQYKAKEKSVVLSPELISKIRKIGGQFTLHD